MAVPDYDIAVVASALVPGIFDIQEDYAEMYPTIVFNFAGTQAQAHSAAIWHLIHQEWLPDWPVEKSRISRGAPPRFALRHDIDDCCAWIDSGGLFA